MPEAPKNLFRNYAIVADLFNRLGVRYEMKEEGIHVAEEQPFLALHPSQVEWAYKILQKAGHYPSIENGSERRNFAVFQYPREKGISLSVHLSVGNVFLHKPVPKEEVDLLEQTLMQYCPNAMYKRFNCRSERDDDDWCGM